MSQYLVMKKSEVSTRELLQQSMELQERSKRLQERSKVYTKIFQQCVKRSQLH